jgi:hypothetical protein
MSSQRVLPWKQHKTHTVSKTPIKTLLIVKDPKKQLGPNFIQTPKIKSKKIILHAPSETIDILTNIKTLQ